MINIKNFQQRRQAFISYMVSRSAALFFAAPELIRSNDCEYPYRQNSNFWYFTGFNEPQALLILIKNDENKNYSLLFNRTKDITSEIWFGRRLGQEAALVQQGVDRSLPWEEIDSQLHQVLNGLDVIYHAYGENSYGDKLLLNSIQKLRTSLHYNLSAPNTIIDWRPFVHEMRLFKSKDEIDILRCAGKIGALAHTRAMQSCIPGMFEYQLEAEIQYEFNRHGARFPSYNHIVAAGENACILHYTENSSKMHDGDLVLVDAGCEFQGYACDITRTFPINGKFNKPQRSLYKIVLTSLYQALSMFRPGISIREVNHAVSRTMILGLWNLGLLKGDIDTLLAKKAHKVFFMHGLSHWLGLDVHDVGSYGTLERDRILEPGMVLTVEPGLYISENANVLKEYRGIGIRIEDDIVITTNGNENLTDSVVKNIEDIEVLMLGIHN